MNKIVISIIYSLSIFSICSTRAQWVQTAGPPGGVVTAISVSGQNYLVGTAYGGVFWSSNFGVSWNQCIALNNKNVSGFTRKGQNTFAGAANGVYISADNGLNWSATSLNNQNIGCVASNDSFVFAGSAYLFGGFYRSSNDGLSWSQTLNNKTINSIFVKDTRIFAGTTDQFNNQLLNVSTNNGLSWTQTSLTNRGVYCMTARDSTIFAGTNFGIFVSTDNGSTWTQKTIVITYALYINGQYVFAGASNGFYTSTDNGQSWAQTSLTGKTVLSVYSTGSNVYAGISSGGILLSNNNGNNWVQLPLYGQNVYSFAVNNSDIYACSYGLYLTQSEGQQWTPSSLSETYVYGLAFELPYIYAAGSKMYVSTNGGLNWTVTVSNNSFYAITMFGSRVIAGAGNGIFISTNHGQNWTQTFVNPISCILSREQVVYTGTANGFYKSIDSGMTFTQMIPLPWVYCAAIVDSTFFVGTRDSGIYISTNIGSNWTHSSLNNTTVRSIAATNSLVLAGTSLNGVYRSTNGGLNWTQINEGIGPAPVYSLLITNTYAYAGTYGSSVWKRPISQIVGNSYTPASSPDKYILLQNYPNPFNPITKIKFNVPADSRLRGNDNVTLKIYDVLGKEVAALVNEQLQPGTYEVQWDGTNYPSGVYFYRLIAGDYVGTKKMVLIK